MKIIKDSPYSLNSHFHFTSFQLLSTNAIHPVHENKICSKLGDLLFNIQSRRETNLKHGSIRSIIDYVCLKIQVFLTTCHRFSNSSRSTFQKNHSMRSFKNFNQLPAFDRAQITAAIEVVRNQLPTISVNFSTIRNNNQIPPPQRHRHFRGLARNRC